LTRCKAIYSIILRQLLAASFGSAWVPSADLAGTWSTINGTPGRQATLQTRHKRMNSLKRPKEFWLCVLVVGSIIGCSSTETTAPTGATAAEEQPADKPFQLGDLLEPFDPPPLAELEKSAEWIDQPVVDFLEHMRDYLREQGAPLVSVEQALAMRNNSPSDNEAIQSALGQLAPPDGAGVDYDSVMVRKANADLKSINPLLGSTIVDQNYEDLTGISLFRFDWDFDVLADTRVVVSWQTSKDHLMDKVVLRDDLTWSDGKPVTAHDFAFTYKAIMTDAVIVPAVRQGLDQLRYVHAYDDHTLVFFHKEPLATNNPNMKFSALPKHIYADTIPKDPTLARSKEHSYLEDHPVVGGAYELTKRVRGQEFVLRRREAYYMHEGKQVRPKPYFKEVRCRIIEDDNTALLALKSGALDETEITAEQAASQTNDDEFYHRNTKVSGLEWTTYFICWNTATPYFSDKRIRQAMSHAIDYEELLNTVFYGLYPASRGTFHPTSWMFPKDGPQPYRQDLDKAEALLDAAGWVDSDGDGIRDKEINGRRVPLRFTMLTSQSVAGVATGILVKESLDQVGVICLPKPTEFTVLVQMSRDRKFQAFMGAWITGEEPDMQTNLWETGQMRNYANYANPKVDALFAEGRREFDREKRAQIYGQIHNILWEDQPYTWLVYRDSIYGFNKRLRGYNFSPRGPYAFAPGFKSIYAAEARP
jgi:peptide/nickel transport system substrate-binding protein